MECDLGQIRADAARTLPQLLGGFRSDASRAEVIRAADEIVLHLHVLAVGALVLDGDVREFQRHLTGCAENGLRLLRLLERRGLERPAASRSTPHLAALAAGDFGRAEAIGQSSRVDRDLRAGEYQDEFLWARVLRLLGAPRPDLEGIEQLLDALEALSLPALTARTAAVRSLLVPDVAAFEAALTSAALQYTRASKKRAAAFGTPVTTFAPHRFLWLEGLALLRLGERAGLTVEAELASCPRMARVPMIARYEVDLAISIDDA